MFSKDGAVIPVTLIAANQNTITLRRSKENDGYAAVQLALPRKGKEVEKGEEKRNPAALKAKFARRREFKGEVPTDITALGVDQFEVGDIVQVSGFSKGKGFQGVVKRHHFKGGPASHGHTDWERKAGSIGQRFPQHTVKGKRMPGRMGHDKVTVKNLMIAAVDTKRNVLAIKGAVPGAAGAIIEIQTMEV